MHVGHAMPACLPPFPALTLLPSPPTVICLGIDLLGGADPKRLRRHVRGGEFRLLKRVEGGGLLRAYTRHFPIYGCACGWYLRKCRINVKRTPKPNVNIALAPPMCRQICFGLCQDEMPAFVWFGTQYNFEVRTLSHPATLPAPPSA